jgi:class 3 adenylate cyclase/CheY-like chemotaxis protein
MSRTGRILIIDDNRMNRRQLQVLLAQQGHQVQMAETGERGLEILNTHPIDVILLDLVMPGMDGFEVFDRLKHTPSLEHIPVIMISAQDELTSIIRAIELGAADYLPRPFDPVLLKARINSSLASKQLRDLEQMHLRQVQDLLGRIQVEQEKSEMLLRSILPASIVERLKIDADIIADSHDDVTVLFADLVGFTEMASQVSASEVVALLDEVFSVFDVRAARLGVEKIKTIGDAYLAAAGLPTQNPEHAEIVAELALGMLEDIQSLSVRLGQNLRVRIGLHSGPVVAGIIGRRKQTYDLWGDTVNTASRLESHGLPGEIQVAESTYRRLMKQFRFEPRGEVSVKGKGTMRTYLLKGRYST